MSGGVDKIGPRQSHEHVLKKVDTKHTQESLPATPSEKKGFKDLPMWARGAIRALAVVGAAACFSLSFPLLPLGMLGTLVLMLIDPRPGLIPNHPIAMIVLFAPTVGCTICIDAVMGRTEVIDRLKGYLKDSEPPIKPIKLS